MKVLILAWEYPPNVVGGLGAHVAQLAPTLAHRGLEVHVVTPALGRAEASERESREGNLWVHRVPASAPQDDIVGRVQATNRLLLARAAELVERGAGWLIHAHDWLVGPAALGLRHEFGLPLAATIHATEHGRNNGIHSDLQRRIHEEEYQLAAGASAIIACSRFMAGHIEQVFAAPADRITVIPNGVQLPPAAQDFDALAFRRRYALDHERIALYVGRLVAEKGIDVLLGAVPKTLEVLPEAKFVIVGSGPALAHARAFAASQDWADKVFFTGFVADAERDGLYRVADVALFPSLYEPFGIVALEAMSFRVPVVAAESGGLAEVVEPNVTGTLVQPGSADSLAWGIVHVLHRPALAAQQAGAAYRVVVDYNWDAVARRTTEVYAALLPG
ncbi:MAG: glycosyltransferase family 4 protein [Chloroflexota bacterium]